MKRGVLITALFGFTLAAMPALAAQCSINTQIPANGAPITSSVIRQNEQAACNDINTLFSLYNGGTLTPGGTAGQIQINNGAGGLGALANPLPIADGGTGLSTIGPMGTCLTSTGSVAVWAVCGNTPPTPGSYIVTQTQVIIQTQSGIGIVTE